MPSGAAGRLRAARDRRRRVRAPDAHRASRGPERGLRGAQLPGARAPRSPNDPGLSTQWNLLGRFGIGMPEAWDRWPSQRGAPAAGAPLVARARQRRGLRAPRPLPARARPAALDLREGATTSWGATGTPTTCSATAPTWPARSPRPQTTAWPPPASPTAPGSCPYGCSTAEGSGDSLAISRAIRYAVRRGADVINLSLEFPTEVRASQIPDVLARAALRAPEGCDRGRRRRQPGRRRRWPIPARAELGDRRGRHHRERLRGRVLERGHGSRRGGAGRRRRRSQRRQPLGRPALPARRGAGAPSTSRRSPTASGASGCRAATRARRWRAPT